ncbi:MAG: EAL domain-containing protein [Acidaminococcaceae bacterium]
MQASKVALPHYLAAEEFYQTLRRLLRHNAARAEQYVLISLDFDNFNFINDLFSYERGDEVLQLITEYFASCLTEGELFTHYHSDNFAFWVKATERHELLQRFMKIADTKEQLADILPSHYKLVSSGGIVYVREYSKNLIALMDKANFARKQAKGNHINTFKFYDAQMDTELEWRKTITLTMKEALHKREFVMYLQPEVLLKTGEVIGAEALVRWQSAKYGLVYPDQFIRIFEQNGFIQQLDFFMLEEACRFLRKMLEQGLPPLPIAINFSKMHMQNNRFVEQVFHLVNGYHLPTKLIEIEFTENIYLEDFQALIDISSELKYLGFKVALDDFGSAYSSLNYLQDLPVDIIKIDKRFLHSGSNTDKGRIIIAKVVELIKSLRMNAVMEGVETEEEVAFLQKLGCDFGQGYYYAKPMSTKDYVQFLQKQALVTNVDEYLSQQTRPSDNSYLEVIPREFQMDNWELYTLGQNIDMGLMKGYLDGEPTVQYVNDRALEYLGYSRQEFRDIFHNSIIAFTHPEDAWIVEKNAKQLIESGKPLQFQTRAIRKDGKVIILQGRSSCVMDSGRRPIGIYAFQDVTKEVEGTKALRKSLEHKIEELRSTVARERASQEALRQSEERYRLIVEQSDDILFEWNFMTDKIEFSDKYVRVFGRPALQDHISVNSELKEQVHPADRQIFAAWILQTYRQTGFKQAEYRLRRGNGSYLWVRASSTAITNNIGIPLKAVGVLTNINEEKTALFKMALKTQLDPLTGLYNKEATRRLIEQTLAEDAGQTSAFFIIDIDHFKEINDCWGHPIGDEVLIQMAQNIRALFGTKQIIGRIGGDEIVVLAIGLVDKAILQTTAKRLIEIMHQIDLKIDEEYYISGSVGIACYPQHGKDFKTLYRLADKALYASKRRGRNGYTIYAEPSED